jgi:hypothetical protein
MHAMYKREKIRLQCRMIYTSCWRLSFLPHRWSIWIPCEVILGLAIRLALSQALVKAQYVYIDDVAVLRRMLVLPSNQPYALIFP